MGTFLGREPVLAYAVVQAILLVATTFGLHLTVEQVGAIQLAALAILSFVVRSKVSPT